MFGIASLIFVVLIAFILAKVFKNVGQFLGHGVLKTAVFVYIGLLLLSVLAYAFIPINNASIEMVYDEPEDIHLYEMLDQGQFDQAEKYKLQEWELSVGDTVHFTVYDQYYYGPSMLVKRTSETDQLRATFYATDYIVNGINVSDKIKPITISQKGNELVMIPPKETEVKFAAEHKEFTITQFTEEDSDDIYRGSSIWHGQTILYVEIPEGVEVTSHPDVYVHIEGEEEL